MIPTSLKQVEKFKYLGVVFMTNRMQNQEVDTQMGKGSAVM